MRDLVLEDFWIMMALTTFLSLGLVLALNPVKSILSFGRRDEQPHVWVKDAAYFDTFGELINELSSESSQNLLKSYHEKQPDVTHFCFLVHGYSGLSQDLAYIEAVMNLLVDRQKHALAGSKYEKKVHHDMVVHVPKCNEYRTKDGVERGGERLVEEMLDTIHKEMRTRLGTSNDKYRMRDVTISILGNSLGGVYGRYAIAKILERTENMVVDGLYRLHFNVFCTTASPHLGISMHTYIPIPRIAEIFVAHTMGDTGVDLFRLNDLLKTMATSEKYLKPLASFRKRIAYANAYRTDFPVSTESAAFLHASSTYPHYFGDNQLADDDFVVVNGRGLIVSTFHTERLASEAMDRAAVNHVDDLAFMSHCLDSLGWKKVFVDLRHVIPVGISLPKSLLSLIPSQSEDILQSLTRQRVVGSRDVVEVTRMPPNMNRISLPLGHNMIVAFSRSSSSTSFNKGGRPVVNTLAKELVDFIFSWESPVKSED